MAKNILVVGGAGYVGSHIVAELAEHGYHVFVLDNLSKGHAEAVKDAELIRGDINDSALLNKIFQKNEISTVMHFAGSIEVGESVTDPRKYYHNNVGATLNLLSSMLDNNVKNFIFSSTCAICGNPIYTPLDEKHPHNPVSPYGTTKLMIETILEDYKFAYDMKYAALRYFNAAGAHPNGHIGESHNPESHLIPLILKTLTGERKDIKIFGTDYDTPDGTCIRDYVHVCDLAAAHRSAMEKLLSGNESYKINLGTGIGHSVREMIAACEEVTGMKVPVIVSGRRAGDAPILVAANSYAKEVIDFKPKFTDIRDLVKTAWDWERNRKF